ncbi:hypothetical protein [Acinetobacter pittii]|uniref:hypothetical protein n=1 Tax=Acinetobacter pittii TaxID=48296 RepID=UPI0024DE796A|nr:hypothetical protein [Acinetobacter pittii]
MKLIFSMSLIFISIVARASIPDEKIRSCFVNKENKGPQQCLLSSYTYEGQRTTTVSLRGRNYYIQDSSECVNDDSCVMLGRDLQHLKEADIYLRNYESKKIIKAFEDKSWTCFKQKNGDLDICINFD